MTAHPTAEWIAQQIVEAFPWNEAPRYLIRDRDAIYGAAVRRQISSSTPKRVRTTRSPRSSFPASSARTRRWRTSRQAFGSGLRRPACNACAVETIRPKMLWMAGTSHITILSRRGWP